MTKAITPEAIAHFVAWLNDSTPYYYDMDGKGWTTREVNEHADYLIAQGLIVATPGDPYTYAVAA